MENRNTKPSSDCWQEAYAELNDARMSELENRLAIIENKLAEALMMLENRALDILDHENRIVKAEEELRETRSRTRRRGSG